MSKKAKSIILMAVAFVLLLIAYFGVTKMNEKKAEQEAKEEANKISIVKIDSEDVTGFSYDYNGADYSFTKDGENWYSDEDKSISLIQEDIETMLGTVADLKAERLIESTDENFADYGLDQPTQTIEFKSKDGSTTVLLVGNMNSTTGSYYLAVQGEKTVYTVDAASATAFQKTLEDLKDTTQSADETSTIVETPDESSKTTE